MNAPYFVTKRIVAMEGDIVRTLPPWEDKTVRIPKGHVWVEGDDPTRSRDSNTFGPLPLGLVNGRIDAILSVELGALCSPAAELTRADAFLPCPMHPDGRTGEYNGSTTSFRPTQRSE